MNQTRIAGIALLVVGLGIAYWGYQEAGGVGSQVKEIVSGSPADSVMVKYIGGAAAAAAGAFLLLRK